MFEHRNGNGDGGSNGDAPHDPGGQDDFPRITHPKKRAFLAAFAVTGTVGGAATASGVSRRSHSTWMREDAEYAAAFGVAQDAAADTLEAEARRRAIEGVRRPVLYKGQQVSVPDPQTGESKPLFEHQYSDTLLIFLLKGARPEKFGDQLLWGRITDLERRVGIEGGTEE